MSRSRRIAIPRTTWVDSPGPMSDALLSACAGFGIVPKLFAGSKPLTCIPDDRLLGQIHAARITLICGASGAGKSSLLRGITGRLGQSRALIVRETLTPDQRGRAAFDLLEGPTESRASTLAQAGLAEPRLWARASGSLSVGERARLRLAICMHRAEAGDTLIADEFASTIDRASAEALCRTVDRWSMRTGTRVILASAHEDLETMIGPNLSIDAHRAEARTPRPRRSATIEIERGDRSDYQRLAPHHYRTGAPATMVRVLRAIRRVDPTIEPSGRLLAGVLVVSMPALNSAWRHRAWAGSFQTGSKRKNAQRINASLRTISRVIVDPRSRGMGVATRLVSGYLADPLTPATESIASMGSVCPFFERAGMRSYELVPDAIDARLLDALDASSVLPERLSDTLITPGTLLARELVTWGKARKLLARGVPSLDQVLRLTPIAACRLCSRPRAYAFVKGTSGDEEHNTRDSTTGRRCAASDRA